jgi:hypothetical protein
MKYLLLLLLLSCGADESTKTEVVTCEVSKTDGVATITCGDTVVEVEDGQDGKNGTDGEAGSKGDVGPAGAAGKNGAPGVDGEDGLAGPVGPQGPAGDDGQDGANGQNGVDGTSCYVETRNVTCNPRDTEFWEVWIVCDSTEETLGEFSKKNSPNCPLI